MSNENKMKHIRVTSNNISNDNSNLGIAIVYENNYSQLYCNFSIDGIGGTNR